MSTALEPPPTARSTGKNVVLWISKVSAKTIWAAFVLCKNKSVIFLVRLAHPNYFQGFYTLISQQIPGMTPMAMVYPSLLTTSLLAMQVMEFLSVFPLLELPFFIAS